VPQTLVMTEHDEAVRVLTDLWRLIDAQHWDGMTDLLDPAVQIRYVHTGEVLDGAGYIKLNRDYPGSWSARIVDMVGDGNRAVSCTHVTDGPEGFWVASFATTRAGRITDLVEVWTEAGQLPPSAGRG
jgi:SnoaL-like domain